MNQLEEFNGQKFGSPVTPLYLGMMLLANYIASSINTETLFGQKDIDDESTKTDRLPGETARNMESRQRQDELL